MLGRSGATASARASGGQFVRATIRVLSLAFITAVALFGGGIAHAIAPAVTNILVSDRAADPLGYGDQRGGVFLLRYQADRVQVAAFPLGLKDPSAVVALPDRTFLVVDSNADPFGLGHEGGCLWRIDPRPDLSDVKAELLSASPNFVDPVDVLIEPEGTFLVLDSNADPLRTNRLPGAVFRVNTTTGNVDLVTSYRDFVQPRSIAWDLDGTVLIVDQAADPLHLGTPGGALFRLNRVTGVVSLVFAFTPPRFRAPAAVVVLPNGDYLIADKDADPNTRGNSPGAIFRLPRAGTPEVFLADPLFDEPIDLQLGVENDLFVMDQGANPHFYPTSKGAVFRYDVTTLRRRQFQDSSLFKTLTGVAQVTGAEVDSSFVSWTDDNQGVLRPGDIVTVRARLRNTGTLPGEGVVMADSLSADWLFLAGTDSVSQGTFSFDTESGVVSWKGDIPTQGSASIRFRVRLWDGVDVDQEIEQALVVHVAGATNVFSHAFTPRREFPEGTVIYGDYLTAGGQQIGALFTVDPDTTAPKIFWSGPPLVRPADLVQMEDDRLAILDTRAFSGVPGAAGPEAVFLFSAATGEFDTLLTRQQGDGLVSPQGITLDRDGNLLLIDKDANPNGCGSGPTGAVFRLDIHTGALTLVISDCAMVEPLDATVDRNGKIYICDYGGAAPGQFYEYDPDTHVLFRFPQNDRWFVDPLGVFSPGPGRFYVAELTGNPRNLSGNHGALFQVTRSPIDYRLITEDDRFVDPTDVWASPDGTVYLTDREADPLGLGTNDPGAVFRVNAETGETEVAAAGPSVHQPDGMIGFLHADLSSSRLNILLPNGSGRAEPGDTLTLRLLVANPSDRIAGQAMVQFEALPSTELLSGTAEIGVVTVERSISRAVWSAQMPANDSVFVNITARVRDTASFGSRAGARALVLGGRAPVTIEQSILVRAPFGPGEIVLADEAADPQNPPLRRGAIFRLGRRGDPAEFLPLTSPSIQEPSALEWDPDGDLVIAAKKGAEPGAIYRVNTVNNALEPLVNTDDRLTTPIDLQYLSNGDLLVVDADAEGPTILGKGAIWKLPAGGSSLELFSSDARYRSPQQVTLDTRGRMFLADRDANPEDLPQGINTGAIFQLSPLTGGVISAFQTSDLPEPTGIVAFREGTLLVTDQISNPNNYPQATGTLWEFNPDRQQVAVVLSSQAVNSPRRSLVLPSGNVLIADRGSRRNGHNGLGSILEFDRTASTLRFHTFSDSFVALSDLAYRPSSYLQFVSYDVTDPNEAPVYPADRLHVRAVLKNVGVTTATNVVYSDTLPSEGVLNPTTANATRGTIEVDGNALTWTGDLEPGALVAIDCDLQLSPFEAEGKILRFLPIAREAVVGSITKDVRVPVLVPLESGAAYIADGDADPYAYGGSPGAILKVDLTTGATRAFYSSPALRQPRDVAMVGRQQTRILLVDSQARLGRGSGALYSLDPVTQELDVIAADSTWVNLQQVLVETEQSVLLLDSNADPFNLRDGLGPGAIYRVMLPTGEVSVAYSDTTLRLPTSMQFLPDGRLAVVDAEADPGNFGARNGAIFAVNLATRKAEVFCISPQWETPISLCPRPEGGFYLADQTTLPFGGSGHAGAVFTISADGTSAFLSDSRFFRRLSTIGVRADNHPILTDLDADPFRVGQPYGAMHAYNSSDGQRFSPLASSSLMRRPSGFFVFNDLVPIDATMAAEQRESGIELRWQLPSEADGLRSLIYRRSLAFAEEEVPPAPEGFELIAGGESFDGGGEHSYLDQELEADAWYAYSVAIVEDNGEVSYTAPVIAQAPASFVRFALFAPAPRPFGEQCRLSFALPNAQNAKLAIYDVSGRRVRTLVRGALPAGLHSRIWDGRDESGHETASGVYFARLEAKSGVLSTRVVRLR